MDYIAVRQRHAPVLIPPSGGVGYAYHGSQG